MAFSALFELLAFLLAILFFLRTGAHFTSRWGIAFMLLVLASELLLWKYRSSPDARPTIVLIIVPWQHLGLVWAVAYWLREVPPLPVFAWTTLGILLVVMLVTAITPGGEAGSVIQLRAHYLLLWLLACAALYKGFLNRSSEQPISIFLFISGILVYAATMLVRFTLSDYLAEYFQTTNRALGFILGNISAAFLYTFFSMGFLMAMRERSLRQPQSAG